MTNITVSYEQTPNPATLKFNTNCQIAEQGMDFTTSLEAERSPLAAKIFGFPWANGVFIGQDFVTITKQDWVDWDVLAEPLAGLIRDHLEAGEPVFVDVAANDEGENDSPIVKQIKSILNREIRPAVALDGGDIVFANYQDGIVSLHMRGACSGCPSSTATLKMGIETRLKELLPEIKEVISL